MSIGVGTTLSAGVAAPCLFVSPRADGERHDEPMQDWRWLGATALDFSPVPFRLLSGQPLPNPATVVRGVGVLEHYKVGRTSGVLQVQLHCASGWPFYSLAGEAEETAKGHVRFSQPASSI